MLCSTFFIFLYLKFYCEQLNSVFCPFPVFIGGINWTEINIQQKCDFQKLDILITGHAIGYMYKIVGWWSAFMWW